MSIGIGLPGGRFHSIISRNTSLPTTRKYRVVTTRENQKSLEMTVFQGEHPRAAKNTWLGTFRVPNLPPGPRGSVAVELWFELINECLLKISAKEESSGLEVVSAFATRDTPENVKRQVRALEDDTDPEVDVFKPKGVMGWLNGYADQSDMLEAVKRTPGDKGIPIPVHFDKDTALVVVYLETGTFKGMPRRAGG